MHEIFEIRLTYCRTSQRTKKQQQMSVKIEFQKKKFWKKSLNLKILLMFRAQGMHKKLAAVIFYQKVRMEF